MSATTIPFIAALASLGLFACGLVALAFGIAAAWVHVALRAHWRGRDFAEMVSLFFAGGALLTLGALGYLATR